MGCGTSVAAPLDRRSSDALMERSQRSWANSPSVITEGLVELAPPRRPSANSMHTLAGIGTIDAGSSMNGSGINPLTESSNHTGFSSSSFNGGGGSSIDGGGGDGDGGGDGGISISGSGSGGGGSGGGGGGGGGGGNGPDAEESLPAITAPPGPPPSDSNFFEGNSFRVAYRRRAEFSLPVIHITALAGKSILDAGVPLLSSAPLTVFQLFNPSPSSRLAPLTLLLSPCSSHLALRRRGPLQLHPRLPRATRILHLLPRLAPPLPVDLSSSGMARRLESSPTHFASAWHTKHPRVLIAPKGL